MLLWDWAIASSILLSIVLGAFIATFILDNVFVFKSNRYPSDDPIEEQFQVAREERTRYRKATYQQIAMVYLNQIINSILEVISLVFRLPNVAVHIITTTWQNRQLILIGIGIGALAWGLQIDAPFILEKLDGFYSCVVTPFVNNIVFSILHTTNIVWTAFVPFYNIWVLIVRQTINGTFLIATKCATSSLSIMTLLKDIVSYFVAILEQTLVFTGIVGDGNLLDNSYNVYVINQKLREAFMWIPDTFSCFCQATSDFSNLPFFGILEVDYIDWILHHSINIPISFVQTFLKIIPPFLEYPDFSKSFFHFYNVIFETGELFDAWVFEGVNTIISIANIDGGTVIEQPSIFIGEATAHLAVASGNAAQTALNITQHIVLPFDKRPITDTQFMIDVFSMDKTFIHLNLFAASANFIITWIVRALVELLLAPMYQSKCTVAGQCLNYVDGQCSVTCLGNSKIQINDLAVKCLFRPDSKNRYNHQSDIFNQMKDNTADALVSGSFYSEKKRLPLDDKNIIIEATKLDSTSYETKIYFENGNILRESIKSEVCTPAANKRDCLATYFTNELETAYGLKGESFYASVGCPIEAASSSIINLFHVLYKMGVDFFWYNSLDIISGKTSLKEGGENIRALILGYVGPLYGRDYDPPCYKELQPKKVGHFEFLSQYNDYVTLNENKCSRPNINEHVIYQFDRIGYFLIANTLERETLGKTVFNLYRTVIENIRILLRLEAEGYGFYKNPRKIYNFAKIVQAGTEPFSLFAASMGCGFNFGNEQSEIGFCNDAVLQQGEIITAKTTSACDVYDDSFSVSTECTCIDNPGIQTGDYMVAAKENTRYYTTQAVSHWCGINIFEYNYIFLARSINGIRTLIQAFTPANLQQGFPPDSNVCDTSTWQFTTSTTITRLFDNTCNVKGLKGGIMCPLGDLLQRVYIGIARFLRKEQRNFIYLTSSQVLKLDYTIWPEVCDGQNALMAVSSLVTNFFVRDENIQQPMSKLVFSLANVISLPFEWMVISLRAMRAFVLGDISILASGESDGLKTITTESIKEVIFRTISLFIKSFTKHIFEVCDGFKLFLNAIVNCGGSTCPGAIFDVIKAIVGILETLLSDLYIQVVINALHSVVKLLSFLLDPSSITGQGLIDLIAEVFNVFKTILVEVVKNSAVWVKFLYDTLLGPVGEIVTAVQGVVCDIIVFFGMQNDPGYVNTLNCALPSGPSGIEQAGAAIEDAVNNPAQATTNFFSDIESGIGSLFSGRRRRLLNENSTILFDVATKITWDDNSRCDRIIMAYQDYQLTSLRPLEKIEWVDCLKHRLMAEALEHKFRVGIPKDLFYNWLRKYTLGYDVIRASFSYVFWYLKEGATLDDLKTTLAAQGIDPEHTMNALTVLQNIRSELFSWRHLKKSLEFGLNIQNDAKGTRVYNNIRQLNTVVTKTEWHASYIKAHKTLTHFYNTHIKYPSIGNINSHDIFSQNVREMLELRESFDVSVFGTAYGAFTDLECPEDALLCLNCAFVDNFLYNILFQAQRASTFYREDFAEIIVPSFEAYWQNVSSYNAKYTRAYREAIEDAVNNPRYGGTLEVTLPFSDWFDGFLNGTYTIEDFGNGVSYFLQGNYSGAIPSDAKIMFANDLQYYFDQILSSDCGTTEAKWTSHEDNVGYGLLAVILVFASPEIFQFFFFRLNFAFSIIAYTIILWGAWFSYLYIVYDLSPLCFPILPSYLVHDFLMWIDKNLFLDCACSYIPHLAKSNCQQQTCDTCNITMAFHDCNDLLPAFNQLGYSYHFVFAIRWILPDTFRYYGHVQYWPFTYIYKIEGVATLLVDVDRELDVTGIEQNCFWLHSLTPTTLGIIAYVGILCLVPLINIGIKVVKESIVMLINAVMILYYLSVASSQ